MTLWNRGYTTDYISDQFVQQTRCKDGKITLNGNTFNVILVPQCQYMPVETLEKLAQLAKGGATILFEGGPPADVPGFYQYQRRQAAMQKLLDGVRFDKKQGAAVSRAAMDRGCWMQGPAEDMLSAAGVAREPMMDKGLQFVRRTHSEGFHYFIVNSADKPFDGWITLGVAAQSVVLMDPYFENQAGVAVIRKAADGKTEMYLQLGPAQSCILRTFTEKAVNGSAWAYWQPTYPKLLEGTWKVEFIDGGPVLPKSYEASQLGSWTTQPDAEAQRFAGTARYTLEFGLADVKADEWLLDLGRVCDSARVSVNGQSVGTLWSEPFQVNVERYLRAGKNTLQVEVTNVAANRIRDMDIRKVPWKIFHDANILNVEYEPFDASNWELRDSGLLGPVSLVPLKKISPTAGNSVIAENWPGWRGPRSDGSSLEKNIPTQWGPDRNILWKTEIPGMGHSSPIVWQDRIFIASAIPDKQQRLLLCLDTQTGKILWQQTVVQSVLEKINPENSYASGTPATDGQKVYIVFLDGKDVVAAAYDFAGKQLWLSRPGVFSSPHGFSVSPVLYDGQLILNCDSKDESFLVSLSCTDGRTLWKVPHPNKTLSYSTPLVRQMAGRTQLIHCGNKGVTSYNPDDGSVLWFIDGPAEEFVASPVYHERLGIVYIAGSYPKKDFLAIRPDGSGNVTQTHIAWRVAEGGPFVHSPMIEGDYILAVDTAGDARCFDAETGKIFWKENLGKEHASPILAGGLVYFLNDNGTVNIIKPGPEFVRVAQNETGQACYASPAVSDGKLYIRGKTHLFCIGNTPAKSASVAQPLNDKLPTLWIIGDSTVKNGTRGLQGWGDPIAAWFDTAKINICNRALGGRSSRTYQTEGLWDKVLAGMKPGDFVLMQFGHNDNGPLNTGRARGSLKGSGDETQEAIMEATGKKEVVHSYGWYIRKYIADTKAKGAASIILSPVPRNMWSEDGKTITRATKDYTPWAFEAAKQGGADFIDLNDIIARHYEAEGWEKVKTQYFMTDRTHTTPVGAELNAACVVEGIKTLKNCKLCGYLLPQPKK